MKINSSNIKSAEYDKSNHILTLVFINRPIWVYSYRAVPPRVWTGFLKAQSQGKYFANYIKDQYVFVRSIGKSTNGKTKRNIK